MEGTRSGWYWLSFSDDGPAGFLGAAVVRGRDIISAVREARRLGINPGGEVLALPMSPAALALIPDCYRDCHLSRDVVMNELHGLRVNSDMQRLPG